MNAVLQQRTPAWLDARIGRITGSRIGAVLGHSPWQSRRSLLSDMVREALGQRVERDSPAMRWGREHEQEALEDFRLRVAGLDDDIVEGGWYTIDGDAYVGYSPDAHVPGRYLIEIKCPFNGQLPDAPPLHYTDQVQLGMHIMDLSECALHFWTPAESKTFFLQRDPQWWDIAQPQISAFLSDFRKAVLMPAEWLASERDDPEWELAARAYIYHLSRIKEHEARLAEVKAELEKLAGDKPAAGCNVKLEYVERAGAVDWKRLSKALDISQETQDAYRAKGTRYARITVAGNDD